MTYQEDCTLPEDFLEQLAIEGLDGLPEMVRIVVNEAMKLERQKLRAQGGYGRGVCLAGLGMRDWGGGRGL